MSALKLAPPHSYNVFAMQRSIKATTLKPAARLLLFVLTTYSNAEGHCWPGVPQLAKDTGHSRSTIFRALKELEEVGYITKLPRLVKGRNTSNRYTLHVVPTSKPGEVFRVSPRHGGGVMVTPQELSIELSIQETEEEDSNSDIRAKTVVVDFRARKLESPRGELQPFVSSAAVLSSPGGVETQALSCQTETPARVVEAGMVSNLTKPQQSEPAEEDTKPQETPAAPTEHRLPSWLQGAKRLSEGERATKEEVIAVVKRAQWDNTALNLALLWCYVPPEVLVWAVEQAEDEAAMVPKDDVRRIGVLRRKFRFKIEDWSQGDDGPGHKRRQNLDEARMVSRQNVRPSHRGINYSAMGASAQNPFDALKSKGGES